MDRLTTYLLAIIVAVVLAAAASSCNTSGCLDNQSSIPLAGFYDYATQKSITIDSLEIRGDDAPNDSILLRAGTKASTLYMPMRANKELTSWIIAYRWKALDNPAFNDTITFRYTATPFFASEECGVVYNYNITGVRYTRHLIDSVGVTDSLVNNVDIERIKIFFRTAEPERQ